jgi:hypothetical protein
VNVVETSALVTSMIGDSPRTVIVSATGARLIVALSVEVKPAVIWMSSRTTVAKPASSSFIVYVPGGSRPNR